MQSVYRRQLHDEGVMVFAPFVICWVICEMGRVLDIDTGSGPHRGDAKFRGGIGEPRPE